MTHERRSRRDFLGLAGAGIAAALGGFTLTGPGTGRRFRDRRQDGLSGMTIS